MVSDSSALGVVKLVTLAALLLVNPGPAEPRSLRSGTPATRQMVVAANPRAAEAGLAILRDGGSATDAAIAAQFVLGLVEPQASGIGAGFPGPLFRDGPKGPNVRWAGDGARHSHADPFPHPRRHAARVSLRRGRRTIGRHPDSSACWRWRTERMARFRGPGSSSRRSPSRRPASPCRPGSTGNSPLKRISAASSRPGATSISPTAARRPWAPRWSTQHTRTPSERSPGAGRPPSTRAISPGHRGSGFAILRCPPAS